jgi:hypothetical protein
MLVIAERSIVEKRDVLSHLSRIPEANGVNTLSHLSHPQAVALAWWSCGMVLARTGWITPITVVLAQLLGQKELTLRQRLCEWCCATTDKRGAKQETVQVSTCFAPLLR